MLNHPKGIHRIAFDRRLLGLKHDLFQEFFAELMEKLYPGDFIKIRCEGRKGDSGCDGYRQSTHTVYQAYAPRSYTASVLRTKIQDNFARARSEFHRNIHEWVFVHNDPEGQASDTVQLLQNLRETEKTVKISYWGPEEIWNEAKKLDESLLNELLPEAGYALREIEEGSKHQSHLSSNAIDTRLLGHVSGGESLPSSAQLHALREQIDAKDERIRNLVDAEGLRLWRAIRDQLDQHDFGCAVEAGRQLEQWLQTSGRDANGDVRGRIYILLANLVLIAQDEGLSTSLPEGPSARKHYDSAIDAFGPSISDEDATRLLGLKAKLLAFEGHVEKALQTAASADDPGLLSIQLAILVDEQRWTDAIALVSGRAPHERWCATAVLALERNGEHEKAREIVRWAESESKIVYWRCLYRLGQAILLRLEDYVSPRALSTTDPPNAVMTSTSKTLLRLMDPILSSARARGYAESGIEEATIGLCVRAANLLSDRETCAALVAMLQQLQPVNLTYAWAVHSGIVVGTHDLPHRLRSELPHSLEALLLAASIEGFIQGNVASSISQLRTLLDKPLPTDLAERAAGMLWELTDVSSGEDAETLDTDLSKALGKGHRIVRLHRLMTLIQTKQLDEAAPLLNKLRDTDDLIWLQVAAQFHYAREEMTEAAELLAQASRICRRLDLYRRAAGLADRAQHWDVLEQLLREMIETWPKEHEARERLAWHFTARQRYKDAIEQLSHLWKENPEQVTYGLSLAVALRHDGQAESSLAVLDELCARTSPIRLAVLGRAQMHYELGHPANAFDSLRAFKSDFWDDEDFLLAWTRLGYASGHDAEAQEAFSRLLDLGKEGRVAPAKLRSTTFDEFVDMMKARAAGRKKIAEAVLQGRLTWLLADYWEQTPTYGAWRQRTQELILDTDPIQHAYFNLYATNGFALQPTTDDTLFLRRLECPDSSTSVVSDITALITLHRLDLLDRLGQCFEHVFIPVTYSAQLREEITLLLDNQPSRRQAARRILEAVDSGRLHAHSTDTAPEGLITVDEHSPGETDTYGIGDLLGWLHEDGQITDRQLENAQAVQKKSRKVGIGPPKDLITRGVLVALSSLELLATLEFLDVVMLFTRVYIRTDELRELRNEAKQHEARDEVVQWHEDLLQRIADEFKFERLEVPMVVDDEDEDEDSKFALALRATRCAQSSGLPLLVDDRMLQAMLLTERRGDHHAAFGTDALIGRMVDGGKLTPAEGAEKLLQLMRWRYRFIVAPSWMLMECALAFQSNPPGRALTDIAAYLHECMRNPGLLGGIEPTEPRTTAAGHFWQAWVVELGRFTSSLWLEERVNHDTAEKLTDWIVREALPAPPRNTTGAQSMSMAACQTEFFVSMVLAGLDDYEDGKQVTIGVQALQRALNITDREYARLVERVLTSLSQGDTRMRGNRRFTRRLSALAFAPWINRPADIRIVTLLEREGLAKPMPIESPTKVELDAIRDGNHPSRVPMPRGPIVLIRSTEEASSGTVHSIVELLAHPLESVRSTAIDWLERECERPDSYLTPNSQYLVREYGKPIRSRNIHTWVPASMCLEQELEGDFKLNLALFRQTTFGRIEAAQSEAWNRLMAPSLNTFLSLDDGYSHFVSGALDGTLERLAGEAATIDLIATRYDELLGHLPLCSEGGLGEAVRQWRLGRPTRSFLGELQNWLKSRIEPAQRVAGLTALFANADAFNEKDLASWLADLEHLLRRVIIDDGTNVVRLLFTLESALARHYLQFLEVRTHSMDMDRLVALAWWAGGAVTSVIAACTSDDEDSAQLKQLSDSSVHPAICASSAIWKLVHPCASENTARFATYFIPQPRIQTAVLNLGTVVGNKRGPNPVPGGVDAVLGSLALYIAAGFPTSEPPTGELWAFDASIQQAIAGWQAFFSDSCVAQQMQALHELAVAQCTTADRQDHFAELASMDDRVQMVILRMLCASAYASSVDREKLVGLVTDADWLRVMIKSLPTDELPKLIDAAIEVCRRGNPPALVRIATALEMEIEVTNDPERIDILFEELVCVSCCIGSVGPIRRVVRGSRRHLVTSLAQRWVGFICELGSYAPPLVAAWFRDVATCLRSA